LVQSGVAVKGYRELLYKLKTQHQKFQAAAREEWAQTQEAGRQGWIEECKKSRLISFRVFSGNAVFGRFKRYLFEVHGKFLPSTQSTNGAAVDGCTTYRTRRHNPAVAPSLVNVDSGPLEKAIRPLVLGSIGAICHFFMHKLNTTTVYGAEILEAAVHARPAGQGLVTVSNHVASIDDPLLLAAALPLTTMLEQDKLRWTLCATDRCFKYGEFVNTFFRAGKVLPLERGAGLEQWGMRTAEKRLADGDWVHVFPEGTRSVDRVVKPAKRGVGRLVYGAIDGHSHQVMAPLIVPLVHSGMEEIMPKGVKIPRVGQKVTVLVGEPIAVDDLLALQRSGQLSTTELYDQVAKRVGETLHQLHVELLAKQAELPAEVLMSNDVTSSSTIEVARRLQNSLASTVERLPTEREPVRFPSKVDLISALDGTSSLTSPYEQHRSWGFAASSVLSKAKARYLPVLQDVARQTERTRHSFRVNRLEMAGSMAVPFL
jgi:1-acyl-sn-glycerol-3-phosphate acyltransferase